MAVVMRRATATRNNVTSDTRVPKTTGGTGCPEEGSKMEIDKVAFDGPKTPDRGYTMRISYLKEPNSREALVEIFKDDNLVRQFMFPAYKIYNLPAHFSDIVDGEIENSDRGYQIAASNGLEFMKAEAE